MSRWIVPLEWADEVPLPPVGSCRRRLARAEDLLGNDQFLETEPRHDLHHDVVHVAIDPLGFRWYS
ncbi:MAG: hypothetical protein Ct9H300mP1_09310 [Planctomycetaceae bacterium]|nr:MAG: hypothetical protein Ct9H300mP1_09310 [Planctomycetaceae bacterium]